LRPVACSSSSADNPAMTRNEYNATVEALVAIARFIGP
jgi:hypothetical protein